jgi:hypothetical protein
MVTSNAKFKVKKNLLGKIKKEVIDIYECELFDLSGCSFQMISRDKKQDKITLSMEYDDYFNPETYKNDNSNQKKSNDVVLLNKDVSATLWISDTFPLGMKRICNTCICNRTLLI